jgi:hypothetical protein
MTETITRKKEKAPISAAAARLEKELNQLVNEQFSTPEFKLLYDTPLTLPRAHFYSLQMKFYTLNRRDCWSHVAARAPLDVKQAIWHHEEDELIADQRTGLDHIEMIDMEAKAIGVTDEQLAKAEPSPLCLAAILAFTATAMTLPWLGGLLSSHWLERRNNNAIIDSSKGGSSVRWRQRLINELGIDPKRLTSHNVHAVADEEHSDIIWDAIARHVLDEQSYAIAIEGARQGAAIDRAMRASLAIGMRMIES